MSNKSEEILKQLELFNEELPSTHSDDSIRKMNTNSVNRDLGASKIKSDGKVTLYHSSVNNSHFKKQGFFDKGTTLHARPDDARKVQVGGKTVLSRKKVLSTDVDLKDVMHHGQGLFSTRNDNVKPNDEE